MLKLRNNKGSINAIVVLVVAILILGAILAVKVISGPKELDTSKVDINVLERESALYSESPEYLESEYSTLGIKPGRIEGMDSTKNPGMAIISTSAMIAKIVTSVITIALVVVVTLGTCKLYKKLELPSYIIKFAFLWPITSALSTFLPDLLEATFMFVSGILGIFTLAYYYKSLGMSMLWAVLTFISLPILAYGTVGLIMTGNLFVALLGLTGIVASLIAYIISNIKLANRFDKSLAFKLGLVFLPFVFRPILGFSKED